MFASSMDGVPRFIPAQTQGHAEKMKSCLDISFVHLGLPLMS